MKTHLFSLLLVFLAAAPQPAAAQKAEAAPAAAAELSAEDIVSMVHRSRALTD
jgi:hypothetical protein